MEKKRYIGGMTVRAAIRNSMGRQPQEGLPPGIHAVTLDGSPEEDLTVVISDGARITYRDAEGAEHVVLVGETPGVRAGYPLADVALRGF